MHIVSLFESADCHVKADQDEFPSKKILEPHINIGRDSQIPNPNTSLDIDIYFHQNKIKIHNIIRPIISHRGGRLMETTCSLRLALFTNQTTAVFPSKHDFQLKIPKLKTMAIIEGSTRLQQTLEFTSVLLHPGIFGGGF